MIYQSIHLYTNTINYSNLTQQTCMIKAYHHSSTTSPAKTLTIEETSPKNKAYLDQNSTTTECQCNYKYNQSITQNHSNTAPKTSLTMVHWNKDYLDLILVPLGLLLMFGYHLFLLYRYLRCPQTTVIGYENHNKRAWVRKMFQIKIEDRGFAISVLSSNASAATSLASISLVLTSLIGAWVGSSSVNLFTSRYIYGSRSPALVYIKYLSLLFCFLVAFGCFVQTARYLVHANFLISMPDNDIPVGCVEKEVIMGSNFWLMGLRSVYFAVNLLMWVFGPIPMFACSVAMVVVLVTLDINTTPLHHYNK